MTSSNPSSTDLLAGDLPLWEWDAAADDFVYQAKPFDPVTGEESAALGAMDGMSRQEFDDYVGPERFRWALCQVTGYASKVTGVAEVEIHEDNPRFVAAADVVYRRGMESPLGTRLLRLPTRDLVDLLIVGGFVLPYAMGVAKGVKSKKGAASVGSQQVAEGDQ